MEKLNILKYVTAFVAGDGGLSDLKNRNPEPIKRRETPSRKNSKYYLKQIDTHLDYIEWQREILENITSTSISHTDPYIDKRGYHCSGQYSLSTSCHPFFTEIRKRVYNQRGRVLDHHYMKLWDWESFATIYMDNGWIENAQREKGIWTRVSIATMSFSYAENKMLRDYMAEKYNVHFDVNHKTARSGEIHYFLRATKRNALYFLDNISKYVLPSYEYKVSTRLTPAKDDDIV